MLHLLIRSNGVGKEVGLRARHHQLLVVAGAGGWGERLLFVWRGRYRRGSQDHDAPVEVRVRVEYGLGLDEHLLCAGDITTYAGCSREGICKSWVFSFAFIDLKETLLLLRGWVCKLLH